MSHTMSGKRKTGGRSALYYESTRSLCSPTQYTSGKGIRGSRNASLQESLECLAQAIERLSSSSRIFNTNYSWILDLNVSGFLEKSIKSESSMGGEEAVIQMSLLDDLRVCEYRAKLRLDIRNGAETPGTMEGKKSHRCLDRIAKKLNSILIIKTDHGIRELHHHIEAPLVKLHYKKGPDRLLLVGRPDIVILLMRGKNLFILSLEYATYSTALETLTYRHALYATGLYNFYGFPVVPALLLKDPVRGTTTYLLNRDKGWDEELKKRVDRVLQLLTGRVDPRPPRSPEICASCPPRIRGLCPIHGG